MKIEDLKLFALFYLKENEVLTDKEKSSLMDFVEGASEEDVLFLLLTGRKPGDEILIVKEVDAATIFHAARAGFSGVRLAKAIKYKPGEDRQDTGTLDLAGAAAGALFLSVGYKINRKHFEKMKAKCEKEKGLAQKTCFNKIRRDSIRAEIVALNSLKVKCRNIKNSESCIQKINTRIKDLQKKMNTIKVF